MNSTPVFDFGCSRTSIRFHPSKETAEELNFDPLSDFGYSETPIRPFLPKQTAPKLRLAL